MSHNIAGMPPFARMPLGGMGMGVNMGPSGPHPESSAHPHPPPPPPSGANPKKKRRTNANVAQPSPQQPPIVQVTFYDITDQHTINNRYSSSFYYTLKIFSGFTTSTFNWLWRHNSSK